MRNSEMTFVSFSFIAHSPQFLYTKKICETSEVTECQPIIMLPRLQKRRKIKKEITSHQYTLCEMIKHFEYQQNLLKGEHLRNSYLKEMSDS